jgi:serine/threonine protein kinase
MTIEQFEHRPRLLGRGSFSSVSLFIDPVTKQRRALKSIIRYSDKCHNEFQHAESLGRHPNLVQYIERRPEGLLLEYADMNLDDYLARHGPISWQTIRQFLHDMLNGLWHIHRKGLCHNDIKEGL